jgi:spore coat polysaccharide biosynthesis predicted glycosyltransferase SpsG
MKRGDATSRRYHPPTSTWFDPIGCGPAAPLQRSVGLRLRYIFVSCRRPGETVPLTTPAPIDSSVAIEIVVDGGRRAGFGHLGRCVALWEELRSPTSFTTSDALAERFVQARGAPTGAHPAAPLVLLDRVAPTTAQTVERLHASGRKVVLLDDLGHGRETADLVVDPPTAARWPPTPAPRLAGFEHVLLRRDIRAAAGATSAGYVLVAIGGSDPVQLTAPLTHALAAAGVDLVYVLGPGYHGEVPGAGRALAPNVAWPQALAEARLFVGGFGHSLLEAAYLGVPAVAAVFTPEHQPHAAAFAEVGTADIVLGADVDDVVGKVQDLLDDDERLSAMSERGRRLIDGKGAVRVAESIEGLL